VKIRFKPQRVARSTYLTAGAFVVVAPALGLFYCTGGKAVTRPSPRQPTVQQFAATSKLAPAMAPAKAAPGHLQNPPPIIRAVYFTGWSAGLNTRVDYLVRLAQTTDINAVVIDIKDYSGFVSYRSGVPEVRQYGAERRMIRDIDGLVERLHREGIYAIARITVFQDPVLAQARPDLAVHRKSLLAGEAKPSAATLWLDRKKLAWIDPASKEAWRYVAGIAKDARAHGFDELNFDYVRFPSDGNLKDMQYPSWDGQTPKRVVINRFFSYLRSQLPGVPVSADLFGLATINEDDLGIGQVIEDGYRSFAYVCPMIYPSHFAPGFLGYRNPAAHPYEVVGYAMRKAAERLDELERSATPSGAQAPVSPKLNVKLRPWLQDFNLGAKYDAAMVSAQIRAVREALGKRYAGYLLWAPSNVYTADALRRADADPASRVAVKARSESGMMGMSPQSTLR
jgi:hypothetical protein